MKLLHRNIKLLAFGKQSRLFYSIPHLQEYNRSYNSKISEAKQTKKWESVVGLEVHAQINAKSKLFSSSPAVFGSPTNTEVSYFDAAFPGTLPTLNKYCVEAGVTTALALNCTVHTVSKFDRKHYFYPDLPAGYQITQQFHPLASRGTINFPVYNTNNDDNPYQRCARLKQIQLEQDSGKTFHVKGQKSFVDLNRAGMGLMELVFEPDLQNGTEAAALVKELILILRRVNTCSCEMEEGVLRVDANISVNEVSQPLGVRTEVKNLNSLRYMAKAIDFEIERQIKLLEEGGTIVNETRSYDQQAKRTIFMRDKEVLQDYRFMPEPNLPPIQLYDSGRSGYDRNADDTLDIDHLRKNVPILPNAEREHLMNQYKLPLKSADKLLNTVGGIDKFKAISQRITDAVAVSDFLLNNVQPILNVRKLTLKNSPLTASQLADIVELIVTKNITEATANDILEMLFNGDQRSASDIIKEYNWYRISDPVELEACCLRVMEKCKKVVKKYRNSEKQRYMTSLLIILYENTNNRAPYKESEDTFKRLILNAQEVK